MIKRALTFSIYLRVSRNLISSIHFTDDTSLLRKIHATERQPEVASNKVILCFDEILDSVDASDLNLRIKLVDSQKASVRFWLRDSDAFGHVYLQESVIIKHASFASVRRLVLNTISDNVKCCVIRCFAKRFNFGQQESICQESPDQAGRL